MAHPYQSELLDQIDHKTDEIQTHVDRLEEEIPKKIELRQLIRNAGGDPDSEPPGTKK
jgi:hypothetical protein